MKRFDNRREWCAFLWKTIGIRWEKIVQIHVKKFFPTKIWHDRTLATYHTVDSGYKDFWRTYSRPHLKVHAPYFIYSSYVCVCVCIIYSSMCMCQICSRPIFIDIAVLLLAVCFAHSLLVVVCSIFFLYFTHFYNIIENWMTDYMF